MSSLARTAASAHPAGEVNGNIEAKTAVELRHPAKMRGNPESPSLAVEEGVLFQGESRMPGAEKAPVRPVGAGPQPSAPPAVPM